ncbi:MAG: TetR family transcriptional regulator [Rhodobacteraceae bacterium]|nr:MAG: TetR family transcriptional regulator [Paracoccaceae bacterium]
MATQRKSAQDRKAEIVATAIRLAGTHGPDRVTTQQLAQEIGISQPAIFRHFPTKSDIWLAVGKAVAAHVTFENMPGAGPGVGPGVGDDPLATLNGLIARHLGQIVQTPAIPAILFSRELHAENEPLRRHFETVMTNRRAGLAGLIARAQAAGQLDSYIPPEDLAALLLAVIQGLAMRWSLENQRFDLVAEGTRLIHILSRPVKRD